MSKLDERTAKFTEAYSDNFQYVFNIVSLKIKDRDHTEDICQEVFSRFFDKIDEIRKPRQWLLGTMRMVLFEYYKKNHHEVADIEKNIEFDDLNRSFSNGFRESRMLIQEVLEDIELYKDEREKILFELIAIYNYTYKETAESLGITYRQVKYRYKLLAKRIVKRFRNKGIKGLEDLL